MIGPQSLHRRAANLRQQTTGAGQRTKGQRTGAHDRPDATTNRKKRNGNRPTTTATIKGQK